MKVIKQVTIPGEQVIYIQRLYYIWEGYRVLFQSVIRKQDDPCTYNQDMYRLFMQDYQDANAEYRLALSNLKDLYAPELDGMHTDVEVSFSEGLVSFIDTLGLTERRESCGCHKEA